MSPRNDDISLKLAKAVKRGFFPDVKNEEIDILSTEAKLLFKDDTTFQQEYGVGNHTRKYIPTRFYGPDNRLNATITHTVGILYAVPFWVGDTFSADRLACEITTGAATATVRMGIYNSTDQDMPNLLQLETAAIDASAVGVKEVTIDYTFSPGLYWLSFVNQVAAIGTRTVGTNSHLPPVSSNAFIANGAALEPNAYFTSNVLGSLPADWAGVASVGSGAPKLMVRAK